MGDLVSDQCGDIATELCAIGLIVYIRGFRNTPETTRDTKLEVFGFRFIPAISNNKQYPKGYGVETKAVSETGYIKVSTITTSPSDLIIRWLIPCLEGICRQYNRSKIIPLYHVVISR